MAEVSETPSPGRKSSGLKGWTQICEKQKKVNVVENT